MTRLTILVDPAARGGRGRGILFADAARITAEDVNAMVTHARGLIAVAMPQARICALDLPPMPGASMRAGRPLTFANVEARTCTATGISAAERAETLRALAALSASPADFVAPGHVIVTAVLDRIAPDGEGVPLSERAHRLAARQGALAIAWADVLADHGDLASTAECEALAQRQGFALLSLVDPAGLGGERAVQVAAG